MMNRRLSITKTTAATRRMAHTRPFKSLCRALKKNSVKTRSDSGEKQKKKRRNQSAVRCWKKNETPVALFFCRERSTDCPLKIQGQGHFLPGYYYRVFNGLSRFQIASTIPSIYSFFRSAVLGFTEFCHWDRSIYFHRISSHYFFQTLSGKACPNLPFFKSALIR